MIRAATALALATAVAVASPASAGRVCNVVTDKRGDQGVPADGAPSAVESDYDILSADLAASNKYVVAVIRLASLSRPSPGSPAGRAFDVVFYLDDERSHRMGGLLGLTEVSAWASGVGGYKPATIAVDYERATVTIYTHTNTFVKPSVHLLTVTGVSVSTAVHVGGGASSGTVGPLYHSGYSGHGVTVDEAEGKRAYKANSPSCVVIP